jgi:hypothetical protein
VCIALFVGLDGLLVERPWLQSSPAAFVRLIRDPQELPRPYFTKRNVYEIGDEEGCACGFHAPGIGMYDSNDDWEMAKLAKAKRSIDWLRASLVEAGQADAAFELYVGDVDELATPTETRQIALQQLVPKSFSIEDYVAESGKEPGTMYSPSWDVESLKGPLWTVLGE